MASNTKITKTRRKNRDGRKIQRRQRDLKKVFQAAEDSFQKIFGES